VRAEPALARRGLAAGPPPLASTKRFADGAAFRIEIPSVEGPRVLEEVVATALAEGIVVNRVSQGSGAMLLRESELAAMSALGADAGIEVSLFVGPREGFDVGAHARTPDGAAQFGQPRGSRGLAYAIEDIARAVDCGIRSFLVADLGLLSLVTEMQREGELPSEVVWKVSVMMAPSNPVALRLLEQLGATTANIPSDMTVAQLAELRATTSLPLDLYVESPDALGGVVRGNELGDLVAAGAPLYAKFGLRNSRPLYPSGAHLVDEACAIAREKVHRAAVALEWLARLGPELVQSGTGAPDLGVPRPGHAATAAAGSGT
jgi:Peptidase family U32